MATSQKKPFVVAVVGCSSSGKSTIASQLAHQLNSEMPQRAGASSGGAAPCIGQDSYFKYDVYDTDLCPMRKGRAVDGEAAQREVMWKDWECMDSVDWAALINKISSTISSTAASYVVVEGFLLLSHPECRDLFDAAVVIEIGEEECWRRRLARAKAMAHLPPGSGENTNYEIVEVYTRAGSEREDVLEAAKVADGVSAEGSYAWLRLYFDDVVWPAAQQMARAAQQSNVPLLRLDGEVPVGKDAWAAARVKDAVVFVQDAARGAEDKT